MGFDCCSSYRVCSEKMHCVNIYPELREECTYKNKLEKGINFFNVNEPMIEGSFILLKNRAYFIGKRSKYGSSSYRLSREEIDFLRSELLKSTDIIVAEQIKAKYAVEEVVSDQDRAVCRVIVTMNELKYNVMNFNIRAIKEDTALKIRDSFRLGGFQAAVEYVGKKSVVPLYRSIEEISTIPKKPQPDNRDIKTTEYIQCSMFDEMTNTLFLRG